MGESHANLLVYRFCHVLSYIQKQGLGLLPRFPIQKVEGARGKNLDEKWVLIRLNRAHLGIIITSEHLINIVTAKARERDPKNANRTKIYNWLYIYPHPLMYVRVVVTLQLWFIIFKLTSFGTKRAKRYRKWS